MQKEEPRCGQHLSAILAINWLFFGEVYHKFFVGLSTPLKIQYNKHR